MNMKQMRICREIIIKPYFTKSFQKFTQFSEIESFQVSSLVKSKSYKKLKREQLAFVKTQAIRHKFKFN